LFAARLLIPVPVGLADNHDGPRLMCGLGVAPVTGGHQRYVSYAYFQFSRHPACASGRYPSSQHLLLDAAKWLTPVLGLPGVLNLIALGLLTSAIASLGIASLVAGLRLRSWARLLMAAAVWLIMADSAFFPSYASPFSDGAALVGLLLVAAGLVYLGRGWLATTFGLLLATAGGALVIPSKEQYVLLVVPIGLTLVLASAIPRPGRWLGRFLTAQTGAAVAVAAILAIMTAAYVHWDVSSGYAARLHHDQAVDVIFQDIVNGRDNARADLHALGLPGSWARYAGTDAFSKHNVRTDPLYPRYEGRLTESTIAHFLLAHPGRILSIGQLAASYALHFRVGYLGNYAPSAGHPPGTLEHRVQVVTWLVRRIPQRLGLWWLVPLWAVMATIAFIAARQASRRRRRDGEHAPQPDPGGWHRDAAVVAGCMTGCAVAAFVPAAYFDGISTTRHMVGMNLATALAVPFSAALAASMLWRTARKRRRAAPGTEQGTDTSTGPDTDTLTEPGSEPVAST